jgi:diaminopimelate decarboxylase
MAFALQADIRGFNEESEAELDALSAVASELGKAAHIAFRVNPDVDAGTHEKISTGKAEDKFGVAYTDAVRLYQRAGDLPGIAADGIHMHIGSQITDLAPYRKAFALMGELVVALRGAGHTITHVDLGGGLGVPYRGTNDIPPHPDEYPKVVRETLGDLDVKFACEPGRMIVGNAGVLVTRVVYTKSAGQKTFVVTDCAMNDLIRPTLYDAYHDVWPIDEARRSGQETLGDVVGPVCETGDFLVKDRMLARYESGDLLALMTTGAYGAVQSGTYNTRRLIPEVLVREEAFAVVRPRQSYDELIALDRLAPWLENTN